MHSSVSGGFQRLLLNSKDCSIFLLFSILSLWIMGRSLEVLNLILRWKNNNMGKKEKLFSLVYIFYCSIKSLNPYEWMWKIVHLSSSSKSGCAACCEDPLIVGSIHGSLCREWCRAGHNACWWQLKPHTLPCLFHVAIIFETLTEISHIWRYGGLRRQTINSEDCLLSLKPAYLN